jgi:esterase
MILAAHTMGEGPVVVLLHGLFGSARNLGGVQRALSTRFRVVALDLRNHGDSPHDPVMDYDTMAADVLETLAAQDALPAAFVGHSMGGKVAMRVALTAPEQVKRVAVADIAPVPYPTHFDAYAEAMLALSPSLSRTEADATLAPAIPEQAVRAFLLHNFRSGSGWRIGLANIAAALPVVARWDDLGTTYPGPALFVTGARSDYVRAEDRPVITGLFPAARFVTIKDAGHWLHSEQAAAFNATLEAFLAPL